MHIHWQVRRVDGWKVAIPVSLSAGAVQMAVTVPVSSNPGLQAYTAEDPMPVPLRVTLPLAGVAGC